MLRSDRIIVVLCCLLMGAAGISAAHPAHAQSTETGSTATGSLLLPGMGTGADIQTRLRTLTGVLASAPLVDRVSLHLVLQQRATLDAERDRFQERMMESRRSCREEIRRANRDALLSTLERCHRGDLALEVLMLRAEQDYMNKLTLASYDMQHAFITMNTNLIDAITTLIEGIDSNVFLEKEQLQDAKRNLRERYRLPYWHARSRLSGSLHMPWLRFMTLRLAAMIALEPPESDLSRFSPTLSCLEHTYMRLQALARSQHVDDAQVIQRELIALLRTCSAQMQELTFTWTSEEEVSKN